MPADRLYKLARLLKVNPAYSLLILNLQKGGGTAHFLRRAKGNA
jgi:hypothetical protein